MELCAARKLIDLKYYDMIDEFKKSFLANINSLSLFGIYSLKNTELIKSQISLVSANFEEKVMELESCIFKL